MTDWLFELVSTISAVPQLYAAVQYHGPSTEVFPTPHNTLSLRKQWCCFCQKSRESVLFMDTEVPKDTVSIQMWHCVINTSSQFSVARWNWWWEGQGMCKSYTDMGGRKMANCSIPMFKSLQKVWIWAVADPTHIYIHKYFWTDKSPVLCIASGTVCDCGRYRRVVGQLNINVARLNTSIKFVKNGKGCYIVYLLWFIWLS